MKSYHMGRIVLAMGLASAPALAGTSWSRKSQQQQEMNGIPKGSKQKTEPRIRKNNNPKRDYQVIVDLFNTFKSMMKRNVLKKHNPKPKSSAAAKMAKPKLTSKEQFELDLEDVKETLIMMRKEHDKPHDQEKKKLKDFAKKYTEKVEVEYVNLIADFLVKQIAFARPSLPIETEMYNDLIKSKRVSFSFYDEKQGETTIWGHMIKYNPDDYTINPTNQDFKQIIYDNQINEHTKLKKGLTINRLVNQFYTKPKEALRIAKRKLKARKLNQEFKQLMKRHSQAQEFKPLAANFCKTLYNYMVSHKKDQQEDPIDTVELFQERFPVCNELVN